LTRRGIIVEIATVGANSPVVEGYDFGETDAFERRIDNAISWPDHRIASENRLKLEETSDTCKLGVFLGIFQHQQLTAVRTSPAIQYQVRIRRICTVCALRTPIWFINRSETKKDKIFR